MDNNSIDIDKDELINQINDPKNRIILSEESFDKVQELINNPPAPSDKLIELMTRPRRYIVKK
ncbi:hypothetical protein [Yersinia phage vB_Yru_GN1]|uniref:DUF1778 domain-containing protein n=1 Tax=Yersinia phage vB_Yru_GN1 TaxID=3074381 RepID=A0AA86IWL2_9CAUD|nr:hypothetical protein [Yersinia phage vB_Yru_GN1]